MNRKLFTLTFMPLLAIQLLGCPQGQYVDHLTGHCANCDQIEHSIPGGDSDLCVCKFGFRFDKEKAQCVGQIDGSILLRDKKPKYQIPPGLDRKPTQPQKTGIQQKPQISKEEKKPEKGPKPSVSELQDRNLRNGK